jgi:hypothetical protein
VRTWHCKSSRGQLADLAVVEHPAAGLDHQPGLRAVGLRGDLDPAPVLVVPDHVVDDVLDHASEQDLAALDGGVPACLADSEFHRGDGLGALGERGGSELAGGIRLLTP